MTLLQPYKTVSQALIAVVFVLGFEHSAYGESHLLSTKNIGDPVMFGSITPLIQTRWAIQALFAPRTLDNTVLMKTYNIADLSRNNLIGLDDSFVSANTQYIALLPPGITDNAPANCGVPVYNLANVSASEFASYVPPNVIIFNKNCGINTDDAKDINKWFLAIPSYEGLNKKQDVWTTVDTWDTEGTAPLPASAPNLK